MLLLLFVLVSTVHLIEPAKVLGFIDQHPSPPAHNASVEVVFIGKDHPADRCRRRVGMKVIETGNRD